MHESPFHNYTLIGHVAAGSLALLTGLIAMITPKGGTIHRIAGKVYFYSMSIVFVSALILSVILIKSGEEMSGIFLLMTGVFSYHAAASGYRVLFRKKGGSPGAIDWTMAGFGLLASSTLIALGIYMLTQKQFFGIVALVFGLISARVTIGQLRTFEADPKHPYKWLTSHIGMMSGSYIAATTAFLVNNTWLFPFIPPSAHLLFWFIPTFIGVPLIFWTIRRRRKNPRVEKVVH